ncbi:unnamed protein product, partial [Phaeothamnion confervicola]
MPQIVTLPLIPSTPLQHGGDILKFAGDAIIVCWVAEAKPGRRRPHHASVSNAADGRSCAFEAMRTCEAELVQSGDPIMSTMGLHIGMGCSRVLGGHVGGVGGRWEFFVTGDAVAQMSAAEGDAHNGEIVVS